MLVVVVVVAAAAAAAVIVGRAVVVVKLWGLRVEKTLRVGLRTTVKHRWL